MPPAGAHGLEARTRLGCSSRRLAESGSNGSGGTPKPAREKFARIQAMSGEHPIHALSDVLDSVAKIKKTLSA